MPDNQRIEDLRRRVQKDPASIAFAQLAEECRRARHFQEAVDTCHAGLAIHPGYLSARVTLGRALIELDQLDDALAELELVLKSAPENLAAIRGVAEIHHRRGHLAEALEQYRAALAIARNDPDLERTVDELTRQVQPSGTPVVTDGLSLEQMEQELSKLSPPPAPVATRAQPAVRERAPKMAASPSTQSSQSPQTKFSTVSAFEGDVLPSRRRPEDPEDSEDDIERDVAGRTVEALERLVAAIHVARADRHA